jgi:hypothetical protein
MFNKPDAVYAEINSPFYAQNEVRRDDGSKWPRWVRAIFLIFETDSLLLFLSSARAHTLRNSFLVVVLFFFFFSFSSSASSSSSSFSSYSSPLSFFFAISSPARLLLPALPLQVTIVSAILFAGAAAAITYFVMRRGGGAYVPGQPYTAPPAYQVCGVLVP